MNRIVILDLVRTILATIVMLGHYDIGGFKHYCLAVDMFFILSGFVLANKYLNHNFCPKKFIIDRIARIFPLFILIFLIKIIIDYFILDKNHDILIILSNALLIPNDLINNINPISWSLGVEFYVNITLLLLFFISYCNLNYRSISIKVLTIFIVLSYILLFNTINFEEKHLDSFYLVNYGTIRGIAGIGLGCITYIILSNISNIKIINYLLLIIGFFIIEIITGYIKNYNKEFGLLLFCLFIILSTKDVNFVNIINSKKFYHIDKISYPIYLIHMTVMAVLNKFNLFGNESSLTIYLSLLITIIISFPTALYIEPFLINKTKSLLYKK